MGKSRDEQYEAMYGEIEAKIEQTKPHEIEQEIRGAKQTDFRSGVVNRPEREDEKSPFNVSVEGPRQKSLEKIHSERSARAQDVDEQQNAPITYDEEKWLENKNRLDYPGVDTIPPARQARRAETAASMAKERGMVDRVEHKGSAKTLAGKFSPKGNDTYGKDENVVRVQGTADQPERTLAHEVGHAIDFGHGEERGFHLTNELFDLDTPTNQGETEDLTEEAIGLSKKARGNFFEGGQYRREYTELTADAIGQAIIQPRATKRDAPKLFERVKESAEERGFGDIFGREDEPMGLL